MGAQPAVATESWSAVAGIDSVRLSAGGAPPGLPDVPLPLPSGGSGTDGIPATAGICDGEVSFLLTDLRSVVAALEQVSVSRECVDYLEQHCVYLGAWARPVIADNGVSIRGPVVVRPVGSVLADGVVEVRYDHLPELRLFLAGLVNSLG